MSSPQKPIEHPVQLPISQRTVHGTDVVLCPGLSIHFFGKTVGIYSTRIQAGRGFAELPLSDLQALVDYFKTSPAQDLRSGD